MAYSRAKCNWMKIRKPKNEPDLYLNGKTGEITAEQPEASRIYNHHVCACIHTCIHTYIHTYIHILTNTTEIYCAQEFQSELERALESNLAAHEVTLLANQELVAKLRVECASNKQQRDDLLRKQAQVAEDQAAAEAGALVTKN